MPGQKVAEDFRGTSRFEIRKRLGAGGMGAVYEAFDRERDTRVALKTILHQNATNLYRFKQEFRALADVVHPNLVRLYELFAEDDQLFFTMELIEGVDFIRYVCPDVVLPADDPNVDSEWKSMTDLELWLGMTRTHEMTPALSEEITESIHQTHADFRSHEASERSSAPTEQEGVTETIKPPKPVDADAHQRTIPEPHPIRLRAALRQLAEALDALHAMGMLHRDIKPSNVLVTNKGRVVLLDFGLTTHLEDREGGHTSEGFIVGTVAYMSPEQAGGKKLSAASDWYSVGVMLYRALTGELPFAGDRLQVVLAKQLAEPPRPEALAPNAPADLLALCIDILRHDPDVRPTGEEIIRRLGGAGTEATTAIGGARRGALFVGRERQLNELAEAFGCAAEGSPTTVFMGGRSGSGKSALMNRFVDGLRERGDAVVLMGRCFEQESVAYKALDAVVDSLSRYLRRLSRLETEALLPRDVAALGRIFPVLRRVDAIAEAPKRGVDMVDVQELRRRAFAALRELLARIGDRKPLVIAIDDVQWGDRDSAALLLELLGPPDPPALMLLCCFRREDRDSSVFLQTMLDSEDAQALPNRRDSAVDALEPAEARELVLRLLDRDDEPAQSLANMIAKESRGNPYFVYELMQFLSGGGEFTESLALTGGAIHLDEVLWRRAARLPRDARLLLETLAVAGKPVRQAVACRAAGVGAEGFAALALLRSMHLARGTGPGSLDDVETYHDRIRETIVDHLDAGTLKSRHQALARELEATGKADTETLAVHFDRSGDRTRAGEYFVAAAAEASRTLAFDRAAKLYREALDRLPEDASNDGRRALWIGLGDALANDGRGFDSAQAYQRAMEYADANATLELQRRAGHQYLVSGHIDQGLAAFRDVLDRVAIKRPSGPTQSLRMLLVERMLLRLRGIGFKERPGDSIDAAVLARIDASRSVAIGVSVVDVIQGSYFQTKSLNLALKAGEPARVALALSWEGVHSACQGKPARRRTERLIAASAALAERIGDRHVTGMAKLSEGCAHYLEGRNREGMERLDRAAEMLLGGGADVVWELDTARIFGVWARFYLGRIAELTKRCEQYDKEARDRGDRYMEATIGVYPAAIALLAADNPALAQENADRSIAKWTRDGFHVQHLTWFYGNIYINLYQGDCAAAWRTCETNRRAIERSLLLRIQHVLVDHAQLEGRAAIAAAAAAESSDERRRLTAEALGRAATLDRVGFSWTVGVAALIRAAAASQAGDESRTIDHLKRAIARLDDESARLFAAAARRRLGALLGGDEGRELIDRADAFLVEQSIKNPEKMTDCLAPGFKVRA